MRLKSYFAGTVEAAMGLASRELGEDAVLVYSREAAPEARYLGRYEVVFGLPDPAASAASMKRTDLAPSAGDTGSEPPGADAGFAQVQYEVQALRAQIERLAAQVTSQKVDEAAKPARRLEQVAPPNSIRVEYRLWLQRELIAQEVPAALAHRVAEQWAEAAQDAAPDEFGVLAQRALAGMVQADASVTRDEAGCRVIAVVGPPGAGKTTALVKIAARFGLTSRRPIQIVSFDNCRIAGAEQLRTYAAILGVGFQAVDTAGALKQVIEEHRNKQLVLIDTAGFSAGDEHEAVELTRFLHSSPEVDVHLALSASMKPADLRRMAERFARFRPGKLLFTRLDETSTFGPLWAESVIQSKPISFFSNGPGIPEDLEEATSEAAAALVLGTALAERDAGSRAGAGDANAAAA